MARDQKNIVARTTTSGSTKFGNPNVQNQVEGIDQ
jgi:hypothetical protein